jgi:type IV pilus assembly protein PilQ
MRNFCNREHFRLLAVIFLLLDVCAVTVAQETQEQEKVLTPVQKKMMQNISVDFRDTPIDDVIRILAKQADLDIVKGPDVTGNVTATLTDVPLEEAMNQILAAYGYGYVASANMIRIVPVSQLTEETERTVSKIYRIVYADVKQVEQALTKVVSKRGYIAASPGSSNIIVTDTESNIKAIDQFIAEIDRVTPQILVEVRIYDIKNTDEIELGTEWRSGRNTGFGTGRATGIGSTSPTGGPVSGNLTNSDPSVNGIFESTIQQVGSTGVLDFGILTEHTDLQMLFAAIQQQDAAKLLANPRIMVLDNELASFKAIEEIPYQQLQQGGYQSFGTTEFKEVGVELSVTPHLATDGLIRLHIKPVFSIQVDTVELTTIGLGGAQITSPEPVVDKREADTIALVKDGETVVIGGLRKQTVNQLITKIPLLGDLPLLGWIFRYQGEETVTSELVVFITPRIVESPVLTELEKKNLEDTNIIAPTSPTTLVDPATKKFRSMEKEKQEGQ